MKNLGFNSWSCRKIPAIVESVVNKRGYRTDIEIGFQPIVEISPRLKLELSQRHKRFVKHHLC